MKYDVEVKVMEVYYVQVEAEDTETASDLAFDAIQDKEGRIKYYNDSDAETTVYNAGELLPLD